MIEEISLEVEVSGEALAKAFEHWHNNPPAPFNPPDELTSKIDYEAIHSQMRSEGFTTPGEEYHQEYLSRCKTAKILASTVDNLRQSESTLKT